MLKSALDITGNSGGSVCILENGVTQAASADQVDCVPRTCAAFRWKDCDVPETTSVAAGGGVTECDCGAGYDGVMEYT